MALPGKKKDLLSSRRRVEDEGEEDEGLEDLADDSQSEASILTLDENGTVDGSDVSEISKSEAARPTTNLDTANGVSPERQKKGSAPAATGTSSKTIGSSTFAQAADVEAMTNGLKINDQEAGDNDALEFEDSVPNQQHNRQPAASTADAAKVQASRGGPPKALGSSRETTGSSATVHNKRVPPTGPAALQGHPIGNNSSQSQLMQAGRGRGRDRQIGAAGFQVGQQPALSRGTASDGKWSHDLHDSIAQAPAVVPTQPAQTGFRRPVVPPTVREKPSMSQTSIIGHLPARIYLSGMEAPKVLDVKITSRQHTRLPDLRPPLRRDKPVRVSIPDVAPKYVFPSVERSFIFIPRAQRPNQQAKLRRGFGTRSDSRRTSIYGGSVYSPSIPMSRRSSVMGTSIMSPTGSGFGRPPFGIPPGYPRPAVRMPSGPYAYGPFQSGPGAPEVAYPLPSEPRRREHRSSNMTMHQPRPQKQMSVASIEGDQQPFHQQLPNNADGRSQSAQTHTGIPIEGSTPLPNIPEGAINAQPFQPANVPYQPYYYPMQPMYYYPPPDGQQPYGYPPMASPVFMQPPPYYMPYMMPAAANGEDGNASAFMQEQNGMVYYYDPNQFPGQAEDYGDPASGTYYQQPGGYYQPEAQ